jgi:hypothetical protein
MKREWTRRRFLETSLKGSMLAGGSVAAGVTRPAGMSCGERPASGPSGLNARQQELLRVTMDEILPASDGMPAASEVGGVEYLDRIARENPKIRQELEKSLGALATLSRRQFGKDFVSLGHRDRVEALKNLEALPPRRNFVKLRDHIYEAYYTQPKVWKLIGYPYYPTNGAGPAMKPFDPALLSRVRKMPELYRKVP